MKQCLWALALVGAAHCAPAFCETASYVYDAQGRLVAAVHDRGQAATDVSAYWMDAASNRSRAATVSATSTIVPVFRFEKSDQRHFYTSQFLEGVNAHFIIEGSTFSLYRSTGNALTAMYRCYVLAGDHHFLSTASDCEGTSVEHVIGYIGTAPGTGLVPLYRFYKAANDDHLFTKDYQDGVNRGYALEFVAGYVPA